MNSVKSIQNGLKDHPNSGLNRNSLYASNGKLNTLKMIKITNLLATQLILVGKLSKILYDLKAIKELLTEPCIQKLSQKQELGAFKNLTLTVFKTR